MDADFGNISAMSGSELRELAGLLPQAKGNAANLPNLPSYLPKNGAVENSAKYILGPRALVAAQSPLTAEQVDFSHDPEVLTQVYEFADGPATLTLIAYPTPQIAAERFRTLQGAESNSLRVRRSGPLVAVVTGTLSGDAKDMLNSVNYEAQVTWNEATSMSKRDNIGNLIVGIFMLIGILLLDLADPGSVLRRNSGLREAFLSGYDLRPAGAGGDHPAASKGLRNLSEVDENRLLI